MRSDMHNCVDCNADCQIFERIRDLVSPGTFYCSNWEFKPYETELIDIGQRLPVYHLDNPLETRFIIIILFYKILNN